MNFEDVLAQEEYLFMEGVDPQVDSMAGSVCSNCVYWEGVDELGSCIEGTCFAMMRVTGYAETCDEFTPNAESED